MLLYKTEEKQIISKNTTINTTGEEVINENKKEEITNFYCVWLTYSEIGELVKGKSEEEYKESLEALFNKLKENKINTVFYQCRAFCDSFYTSEIFPVSKYVCADNKEPSFDPLKIFAEMGNEKGISVHCWVNPYRVSYDKDFKKIRSVFNCVRIKCQFYIL